MLSYNAKAGIALSLILLPMSVSSAFANGTSFGNCERPNAPALPTQINSESEANALLAQTSTYVDASAEYSSCLAQFATDNQSAMSSTEKVAIKTEFQSHKAELGSYTIQWNALYKQYKEQE